MNEFQGIAGAVGPWVIALGMVVTVYTLIARARLIPESLHNQRMADKDKIIGYLEETNERVLAVADTREQAMKSLMEQLTVALTKANGAGVS